MVDWITLALDWVAFKTSREESVVFLVIPIIIHTGIVSLVHNMFQLHYNVEIPLLIYTAMIYMISNLIFIIVYDIMSNHVWRTCTTPDYHSPALKTCKIFPLYPRNSMQIYVKLCKISLYIIPVHECV